MSQQLYSFSIPILILFWQSLSLKQSDKIFNSNLSCQPLHPLFSLLELPSLLEKSYSFPPSMLPSNGDLDPAINVTIHYCYNPNSKNGPITSSPLTQLPSLQSGEMRSLNHFLFDLVVKLLQLELENLKNGPEKKETPSNGTGLDRHRSTDYNSALQDPQGVKGNSAVQGLYQKANQSEQEKDKLVHNLLKEGQLFTSTERNLVVNTRMELGKPLAKGFEFDKAKKEFHFFFKEKTRAIEPILLEIGLD